MSSDRIQHQATRQKVDFTFMYAAHDAFRRDLELLSASLSARHEIADAPTGRRWATFKRQLHVHHTVEDKTLWPPLQRVATGPREQDLLARMEAEHAVIDPLLARVDAALAARGAANLDDAIGALSDALTAHMQHEEEQALPLVDTYLGAEGWAVFQKTFRRAQGIKGLVETLPWLLEEASPETEKRVLGELPALARVIFRRVWQPRYARSMSATSTGDR
jgi:hemerythrin-like domain-containing protein